MYRPFIWTLSSISIIYLFREINSYAYVNITQKFLLPYETCIARIVNNNLSNNIYEDPICFYLKNYSKFDQPLGNEKCTLGFGTDDLALFHPQNSIENRSSDLRNSCLSRSIHQRDGLRSSWQDSNSDRNHMYYAKELLLLLAQRGIFKVLFIGDSITRQVLWFYICDLGRIKSVRVISSVVVMPYVLTAKVNVSRTKTIELEYKNLYSERLKLPQNERVLIIFNHGLHIHGNTKQSKKDIESFANFMLQTAKMNKDRMVILYRETSAQHFNRKKGGDYDYPTGSFEPNDFCCDMTTTSLTSSSEDYNWRNNYLKYSLSKLDSNWGKYIGWIPFFNITSALYDLHLERHYGYVDCTHFIYVPFMFLPLWRSIYEVLNNMT